MFGLRKVSAARAFALGKIPGHPEFLRTEDPLGAALDEWLDAGWQHAHATRGPDWEQAFSTGPAYGFVWNPGTKSDSVACGVIAPSTDAVGRAYPLVVACPVPFSLMAARWASAPMASENLLGGAYALVVDGVAGVLSRNEVEGRLKALDAPGVVEWDAADEDYAAWSEAVTLEDAWSPLSAELGGTSAVAAALDGLLESLAPLIRRERPATSVLVRLPLAALGSHSVALWLDVVKRIGRWKQSVPSFFWAAEGDTMLLSVAPARPATLAELWHPDPHDESVFDLRLAVTDETRSASGISTFVSENPEAPLGDLLTLLGSV